MTLRNEGLAKLDGTRAPFFPYAKEQFSREEMDYFINMMRQYFIQVDRFTGSLIDSSGGAYLDFPNALFFDTADQPIAVANTAYPVRFNQTYLSNGIRLENSGTEIHVDRAGIYNFQFSGQLTSTNSSSKNAYIWIKRAGTNIAYSAHLYTISGSGTHLSISWNFDIDVAENQILQIMWSADSTNIQLDAVAPAAPHPGSSSAVIAINYISRAPQVLPTPP
jgi:hypothetical protein